MSDESRPPDAPLPIEIPAGEQMDRAMTDAAAALRRVPSNKQAFSAALQERLKKQRAEQADQAQRHMDRMAFEDLLREEERTRFGGVETFRRRLGYGLGLVSILLMVGLVGFSFWSLHSYLQKPTNGFEEHFTWLLVAGHAVITVAAAFFSYQLLRASERLSIPAWWAKGDSRLMGAMLGIESPISKAMKAAEKLVSTTAKAVSKAQK